MALSGGGIKKVAAVSTLPPPKAMVRCTTQAAEHTTLHMPDHHDTVAASPRR